MDNLDILFKLIEILWDEIDLCEENECYISALILYGALLEAILLSMCFVYSDEVKETMVYKQKNKNKKIKGTEIFLKFNLNDLIKIAEELNWFPMENKIEDIGIFKDWIKWIQESRNLIHPARWLKPDPYFGYIYEEMQDFSKEKYKKFVEISKETIEGVSNLLEGKVGESLLRKFEEKNK